jgi:hypothetical protein
MYVCVYVCVCVCMYYNKIFYKMRQITDVWSEITAYQIILIGALIFIRGPRTF